MQPSFRSNIPKLYLIKLSKWLMLIMPIVALFYHDNGLDNKSIFILQAIYSLSVAIIEIPSGYLADVIGRKTSLIFGSILGTLGFVVYSASHSFEGFLCAEIILGIGGSFISGSDSALLYDSLAADKKEHSYLQYEGRITSLGNFAETFAAIGGGLIAAYLSYRSVYIAQTMIASIAIPAAILLKEPPRERLLSRPSFKQIISISYQSLFINLKLSSTICFSAVIGTATLCMAWTAQVYFVHSGLTENSITPLWVFLNLAAALVAAYAGKIHDYLGPRLAMLVIVFAIPCGYIFLGILPFYAALFSLFFFYFVRGYATPLLKDLVNKNCPPSIRATVLSIRSMIIRASFAIIGPTIGYIDNLWSLPVALVCIGFIYLAFALLSYVFIFTMKAQTKTPQQVASLTEDI